MFELINKGISAKGRAELKKHINGKRLRASEALRAKCYDCMGGYKDGKHDCEVPGCSLYPQMPYKGVAAIV
tara:strand:- start:152 stop:364 length:213 start_codon:yes stop_codon:yes gene_type:complete